MEIKVFLPTLLILNENSQAPNQIVDIETVLDLDLKKKIVDATWKLKAWPKWTQCQVSPGNFQTQIIQYALFT